MECRWGGKTKVPSPVFRVDRASNLLAPRQKSGRTIRLLSTKAATKGRSKRHLRGGMWERMASVLIRFPQWRRSGKRWRTQKRPQQPRNLRDETTKPEAT